MSDYVPGNDLAPKYPGLRRLVGVLRLYGYANLVVGALAFVFLAFNSGIVAAIVAFVVSWAQGMIILMLSEVPQVFMDTEENTRGILLHLQEEARRPRSVPPVSTARTEPVPAPPVAPRSPSDTTTGTSSRSADLAARVPKA